MNTDLLQIAEFLTKKRDGVSPNSDKAQNKGALILCEWEGFDTDLETVIVRSLLRLQRYFHETDKGVDPGSAKLTAFISSAGQEVIGRIGTYSPTDEETWYAQVYVGALIAEAFVEVGLVSIDRNCGYLPDGARTAPYMIHATELWGTLEHIIAPVVAKSFNGLSFTKPAVASNWINSVTRRPYVKRMRNPKDFLEMKDTGFMSSLNNLQHTAWRVNTDVLEVASKFQWDNVIPKIPRKGSKHIVTAAFKTLQKEQKKHLKNRPNNYEAALEKYEEASSNWAFKRDRLKERSTIIDRLITIQKTKELAQHSHFYYFMEADYRGRVYYAEPYINYQSSDLSKAFLEFAEPKPMTTRGLEWLMTHLASCYNQTFTKEELIEDNWTSSNYVKHMEEEQLEDISVDKMSLEDRVRWSYKNLNEILRLGENKALSDSAEKPWMFLAACIELFKSFDAINNGIVHMTHLPIPVDGTANGSQHSAAINKDTKTAKMVGIIQSDFPVDLYLKVGKVMTELQPGFFEARAMPYKAIRKNISKRATMTRAYSAGRKSISDSMFADCYKNGATSQYNITAQDCFELAATALDAIDTVCPANASVRHYLQQLVKFELGTYGKLLNNEDATDLWYDLSRTMDDRKSAGEEFEDIQIQLDEFEDYIKSGNGSPEVNWVTPSGFIVRSRLNKTKPLKARVSIGTTQLNLVGAWSTNTPDIRKHISSIAANFIHSMDSSHCANVVTSWYANGFNSFGAVHDSFAVHASDVDDLVHTIKDEFIKLYDVDNFYQFIKDSILSTDEGFEEPMPTLGKLDINEVMKSDYFFA